jgi:signal transduction histidine kinase
MAVMVLPELVETRAATSGTQETDASAHVRTQFLRRVAHDIASPTGVTMTVLDELATAERPRPELIAMARRSLRRLMRLSEHLALVAELEAGSMQPEPALVELRSLVKQAVDDAVAIDGRKDVVAACDLPGATLLVQGDSKMLLVVVREIVGNALKLASSRVEVTLRVEDGHAVVRVDDDGPGFTEEAKATLGQRFVRRGSTRGLGLSLSMAKDILRDHRGSLELEASILPPGRRGLTGAAVIVTLPEASPAST